MWIQKVNLLTFKQKYTIIETKGKASQLRAKVKLNRFNFSSRSSLKVKWFGLECSGRPPTARPELARCSYKYRHRFDSIQWVIQWIFYKQNQKIEMLLINLLLCKRVKLVITAVLYLNNMFNSRIFFSSFVIIRNTYCFLLFFFCSIRFRKST